MKKSIFCFLTAFILSNAVLFAQEYTTGIGGRWGKFNSGITFKYMFDASNSSGLQVDASRTFIYSGGYTLKAFFIKQRPFTLPIFQIPLDFVYGIGLHGGYFPYKPPAAGRLAYCYRKDDKCIEYEDDVITVGIDGTLQIEYLIPDNNFPFSISVDFNPYFEFIKKGPEYHDWGVSVRYTF